LGTHPRTPSLNNPWVCRCCWDQLWSSETLERKCATKKIGTLEQPQLAPSWQRARPHIPENHAVCE
jgi:hypothetical protein